MSFLADHHAEIINRERDNGTSIHLYGTGAYWVAFERSACQLCRMFSQIRTAVFHFRDYPFPVVMASVADDQLQTYARRHILRSAGPDYKILSVPELPFEQYKRWYRQETGNIQQ